MCHSLAWNHDGQGRCVCGWRNFLKEVKSQDVHLSLPSVSSGSKNIYWQPRWRPRWLFIKFVGDMELREPRRGNLGAGLWKSVGGWGCQPGLLSRDMLKPSSMEGIKGRQKGPICSTGVWIHGVCYISSFVFLYLWKLHNMSSVQMMEGFLVDQRINGN